MAQRNIFNRQKWKLEQRWFPEDVAKRIAYKQQLNNWNIYANSYTLTDEWKQYSWLYSEKRDLIRKNRANAKRQAKKNSALNWIL